MHIHYIGAKPSILNTFVSELRHVDIQKDRMRFRKNLERIGEILGFELSKILDYKDVVINTPLGKSIIPLIQDNIVLCTILRAGLPLQKGIQNYFDKADTSFISAYRKHTSATDFEIVVEYLASNSLEGKTLILSDPMLATGQSLWECYSALLKLGTPKETHLVSAVGAREGVAFIENNFPKDTHLWIAAIDENLNDKGYIIPGLGDAGDLAFGSKLQQ